MDIAIGGVVLWAIKSWNLNTCEKRRLNSIQLEMCRKIVAVRRCPNEDGLEWMRRANCVTRQRMRECGLQTWLAKHLRAKWLWAGHVARMPNDRWARKLTGRWRCMLNVPVWQRPLRARRGPPRRWENDLQRHCDNQGFGRWEHKAADRDAWLQAAEAFAGAG